MSATATDRASLDCEVVPRLVDIRPVGTGSATVVTIGAIVVDISAIDNRTQKVALDILATLSWYDARLASLAGCSLRYDQIWTPGVQIANSGPFEVRDNVRVSIDRQGRVQLVLRFHGELSNPHAIHAFPFDHHRVELRVVTPLYSEQEVLLQVDQDRTLRSEQLSILDWRVGALSAEVRSRPVPYLGQSYSELVLQLPVQRRSEFYIYKIILPLLMIVLMSWAVFWIDPRQLAPQMGVAATSMLTLIAFQFAQNSVMPRVSYLTVMDRFIFSASALVFLAFLEAVVTGYLVGKNQNRVATAVDRACRWLFPTVFAVLLWTVFT